VLPPIDGATRGGPPPLVSDATGKNGSVLWRSHRQLCYKQLTVTHQSSLSWNTSCKDDTKSQGWNSVSSLPVVVNADNKPSPLHFIYLLYVSTDTDEWPNDAEMETGLASCCLTILSFITPLRPGQANAQYNRRRLPVGSVLNFSTISPSCLHYILANPNMESHYSRLRS